MLEAATRAWTGAAADAPVANAPAATSEADNGHLILLHRQSFFFGVFSLVVENMMGKERRLQ
jgi:hypothetical protein